MGNFEPTLCLHKTATVYYFCNICLSKKNPSTKCVRLWTYNWDEHVYSMLSQLMEYIFKLRFEF